MTTLEQIQKMLENARAWTALEESGEGHLGPSDQDPRHGGPKHACPECAQRQGLCVCPVCRATDPRLGPYNLTRAKHEAQRAKRARMPDGFPWA